MSEIKRINDPLTNFRVEFLCSSREDLDAELSRRKDSVEENGIYGLTRTYEMKRGKDFRKKFFIWVDGDMDNLQKVGVLAHETLHLTVDIERQIRSGDFTLCQDFEESFICHFQQLFDRLLSKMAAP